MKKRWISGIAVLVLLVFGITLFQREPAKALTIGELIPEFSLQDENGNLVKVGPPFEGPLVLYFYPKDNTRGCTEQACAFRDAYATFSASGVRIIGISSDSPESHRAFKEQYQLPFTLLSDTDGALRKALGIPNDYWMLPGRVTYVIDSSGVVRYVFNSQWQAEAHVSEALAQLKALQP